MYQVLTFLHSFTRWLVLAAMLLAIYRACRGYISKIAFTKTDNAIRHWTATIAHMQLIIGMTFYFKSPVIHYFWMHKQDAIRSLDITFFGLIHPLLMLCAVTVITIGSALAKRKPADRDKFRLLLIWFSAALIIIIIAIPWPFSPLASRPYLR